MRHARFATCTTQRADRCRVNSRETKLFKCEFTQKRTQIQRVRLKGSLRSVSLVMVPSETAVAEIELRDLERGYVRLRAHFINDGDNESENDRIGAPASHPSYCMWILCSWIIFDVNTHALAQHVRIIQRQRPP